MGDRKASAGKGPDIYALSTMAITEARRSFAGSSKSGLMEITSLKARRGISSGARGIVTDRLHDHREDNRNPPGPGREKPGRRGCAQSGRSECPKRGGKDSGVKIALVMYTRPFESKMCGGPRTVYILSIFIVQDRLK